MNNENSHKKPSQSQVGLQIGAEGIKFQATGDNVAGNLIDNGLALAGNAFALLLAADLADDEEIDTCENILGGLFDW